jgi:hypothetical protein
MHATVALLEAVHTTHFEGDSPVLLRRGDVGTVVMLYDGDACEVEFSDRSGRTYALLPLPANRLLVLHDTPERVGVEPMSRAFVDTAPFHGGGRAAP